MDIHQALYCLATVSILYNMLSNLEILKWINITYKTNAHYIKSVQRQRAWFCPPFNSDNLLTD